METTAIVTSAVLELYHSSCIILVQSHSEIKYTAVGRYTLPYNEYLKLLIKSSLTLWYCDHTFESSTVFDD